MDEFSFTQQDGGEKSTRIENWEECSRIVTRPSCEKGGQEERKKKGVASQGFSKIKTESSTTFDRYDKELGFLSNSQKWTGDLRVGNLNPPTKLVYTS